MDLMVRELKDDMKKYQQRDLIMALYKIPNNKNLKNEEQDQLDNLNILKMLQNPT